MRAVPGLSIVCVVTNRQWIGSPCSGAVVSRMSRRVKETVIGRSGAAPFFGLRTWTQAWRRASSALRGLRPGAAGIVTTKRQVVGKGKQRGVLVCRRLDPAVL